MPKFYYYDDDQIALGIFESIIADEIKDAEVYLFDTTEEAIAIVMENEIDILFLDLHIKPHDGMLVFEEVHAKKPDMPIVFISAGILSGEVEWARMNGLTACIEKPVSPDSLIRLTYDILEGNLKRFRFLRSISV